MRANLRSEREFERAHPPIAAQSVDRRDAMNRHAAATANAGFIATVAREPSRFRAIAPPTPVLARLDAKDVFMGPGAADALRHAQKVLEDQKFSKHRQRTSSQERVTKLDPGRQRYAHGGFMGAAAEMMKDARWNDIYRTLMPKHHAKATAIKLPDELMLHMENNPVLAAYGSMLHQSEVAGQADPQAAPDDKHQAMTLEWDVWLPLNPTSSTDILSKAKIAHGGTTTTMLEDKAPGANRKGHIDVTTPAGKVRMPVGQDVYGPDIPTGSGWMTTFGQAIAMARGARQGPAKGKPGFGNEPRKLDPKDPTREIEEGSEEDRKRRKRERVAMTGDAKAAAEVAREFLGPNGGLHVEIKSWDSKPADVKLFVDQLTAQGIKVRTVSSWKFSQLSGVDKGVSRTKWVHGLKDLIAYVEKGRSSPGDGAGGSERDKVIEQGDEVGFNAGSLLREHPRRPREFIIDEQALKLVTAIQRSHKLKLQLYVQENAASPQAVDLVTKLANSHKDVFELGFGWGNISGRAEGGTTGGSGFGKQAFVPGAGEHDKSKIPLRVRENL